MDEKIHSIVMEERRKISVSAVTDVPSFNEREVVIKIKGGTVLIKGAGLHVEEMSKESGDALITADAVESVTYGKAEREKGSEGFFGRLLK